jgi:hypothetical protein
MKTNYIISAFILSLVSLFGFAQVDVTFRVDMSAETVSENGVHVAGTINGWSTDSTPLVEEGNSGIYAVTIQLDEGWHRYKFLNGNNWGTDESAGYPCAPSNGDRFMYVNDSGSPVVLEAVPFNGCNPDGTGFSVTFNVEMASEENISGEGVHMAGWHTDWNTGVLSLPEVDGTVHSGTLRLPTPSDYAIEFEYKFLNGNNWGTDETPGPDSECPSVTGDNRLITVTNSGENIYDVFNGCTYSLNVQEFQQNDIVLVYDRNSRKASFSSSNSNGDISSLQVFDLNGRQIRNVQQKTSIENTKIDFQGVKNGIYLLRFKIDNQVMVRKISVH